ncbi:hypothetical protein B0H15DRAFT_991058 [Mycena belliarum]|uniref:Uncharacterized protein n=1 Tax=Mycena belliarum TaxID=1033014 RepID=A0AAD6UF10_9AGAR|nr:hypothetical protein B0H15DRAFT_991058 [Mycena belliae]
MRLLSRPSSPASVAELAPVLLLAYLSTLTTATVALAPRIIIPSLVPAACTTACAPATADQSTCGGTGEGGIPCLCTPTRGANFAQCITCVVGTAPGDSLALSAAHGVLDDYTSRCAQHGAPIASLTLSLPTASPAPTGAGGNNAKANGAGRGPGSGV